MGHNYEEYFIKEIMNKYSDMVFRICIIYLRNNADAEDAFQEVFIKIMKYKEKFINNEHEKAWIITVTSNHCKNILRKKKRETTISFDESYFSNSKSQNEELLPVILNLPLEYRNVIYLYYYEGYSTKEISNILKRRDATIRTWLKRGRERIGGALKWIK